MAASRAATLKSASLLVAIGRQPVTSGLGLEALGVTLDRGYVNKRGSALIPTWLGFSVVRLLEDNFSDLVDYQKNPPEFEQAIAPVSGPFVITE